MGEEKNSQLRWFWGHFEEVACVVIFTVMTLIAFGNILSRYLFKYSFAFTEELVVSLFVWLTLLGAGAAFRYGSHLGFTLLAENDATLHEADSGLVLLCVDHDSVCRPYLFFDQTGLLRDKLWYQVHGRWNPPVVLYRWNALLEPARALPDLSRSTLSQQEDFKSGPGPESGDTTEPEPGHLQI